MSLQQRLETIRSSPIPQSEESAKVQILVPILQNLGWDPSEMLPEHQVGEMSRSGRVDIALKTQGRILGLIEAKAPGTRLDNHVDQVLGYAFYESVEICALTTGLEWWLYLPGARVPIRERRFAVLRILEDPIVRLSEDFTSFFSKESLVNRQAEEQAKLRLESVRLNSEVPNIWKQMLQEPDDELVRLVQRRVNERAHLHLTSEQVAAALQGSSIPSTATTSSVAPLAAAPSEQDQPAQWWRSWGKPTAIVLWGKRHIVSSNVDAFRTFLDLLYERHHDDFDRVLEVSLPGHSFPPAARDPKELGKTGEREHHQPNQSRIFFTEDSNPKFIEKKAVAFLTCFDHNATDFELRYD